MQKIISTIKSIDKKQWSIIGCCIAGCVCGWTLREAIKTRKKKKEAQKRQEANKWIDGWKVGYSEALKSSGYAVGFKDGYNQAMDDIEASRSDVQTCAYQQGYYNGMTQNLEYPDDVGEDWV